MRGQKSRKPGGATRRARGETRLLRLLLCRGRPSSATFFRRGSRAQAETMDNVRMWTQGVPVEEAAYQQIRNIAALPILGGHVAIMPDVHVGKGATVGAVIPTRGAIIPAAVGVDIGCGMVAVRTTLKASDLPDSLASFARRSSATSPSDSRPTDKPLRPQGDGATVSLLRRIDGLAQTLYAACASCVA